MEIKITNLTKEFQGVKAVDHITLEMHNGVYGLLGVNGAGKTTLMRMLCTLIQPSAGTITCDGKDIFKLDSAYRKILGYLPQEFGFYPEFTVNLYEIGGRVFPAVPVLLVVYTILSLIIAPVVYLIYRKKQVY